MERCEKGKAQRWVKIISWEFPPIHPSLWFFCHSPWHWLKTSPSFAAFTSPRRHHTDSPDFSHISTLYLFNDFIQTLVTSSLDESFIHFIHSTNIGWVSASVQGPRNKSVSDRSEPSVMRPAMGADKKGDTEHPSWVLWKGKSGVLKVDESKWLRLWVQTLHSVAMTCELRPEEESLGWWREFSKQALPWLSTPDTQSASVLDKQLHTSWHLIQITRSLSTFTSHTLCLQILFPSHTVPLGHFAVFVPRSLCMWFLSLGFFFLHLENSFLFFRAQLGGYFD